MWFQRFGALPGGRLYPVKNPAFRFWEYLFPSGFRFSDFPNRCPSLTPVQSFSTQNTWYLVAFTGGTRYSYVATFLLLYHAYFLCFVLWQRKLNLGPLSGENDKNGPWMCWILSTWYLWLVEISVNYAVRLAPISTNGRATSCWNFGLGMCFFFQVWNIRFDSPKLSIVRGNAEFQLHKERLGSTSPHANRARHLCFVPGTF